MKSDPASAATPADTGAQAADGQAAKADARLRQIFRLWLRDGHVHPLIHLLRRYRGGDRE